MEVICELTDAQLFGCEHQNPSGLLKGVFYYSCLIPIHRLSLGW
jgi:hypothetical protein